ncbi:hypothetical protein [Butyricicoccus sp.]|uniref:hypothetical protein n=1 Tax=Butyricicoccus sp. TaxID=2049021 RepID=UPI003F189451
MDDLDLEKLKQELDDVSGGSRYDIDDIMREAGASEPEEDKESLEQLMQRFGIRMDEPQSKAEGFAAPVTEDMMPKLPETEDLSALFRAAEQTQDIIDQQNELAEDAKEPEQPDPLEEQEDVFARLFNQLGQIEQDPVDMVFSKPAGHTQTEFIDPRTEMLEEPEEEPDLMARLFDNPPISQSEPEEAPTYESEPVEPEIDQSIHIDMESTVHWEMPETLADDTELFTSAVERTQIMEPVEEEEPVEEVEEPEAEPEEKPEKKGFWSKWFGADDDEADEDETDEDAEEEELPDAEETELFEPVDEQATQIMEPIEPAAEEEPVEEVEEPEAEPEEKPEKKGFWSKWFGADEDETDEDETDEDAEEEELPAEEATELFEPVNEQATQIMEPIEPAAEEEPVEEAEEPEAEPEKKGFWSKWFGADEDEADEDETDEHAEEEEPSDAEATEVFEPVDEQATQIMELIEPAAEEEPAEEVEEPEAEPEEKPEKKGFWSKWFGANEDEADENETDEDAEEEEPSDAEATEVFEPVDEQATQIMEPIEPAAEEEPVEEAEEPEAEPEEKPEKKGFWSKWFGADDDEADEDEADEDEEALPDEQATEVFEPIADEQETQVLEAVGVDTVEEIAFAGEEAEAELPEEETAPYHSEKEQDIAAPEEVYFESEPEEIEDEPEEAGESEDAGVAAFADAMAQEEAVGATEETPEAPRRPQPEDIPVISEEELEEFLSGVEEEPEEPIASFEQILREGGIEPEQSEPEPQKISLEEFPEEETTVYVDIPVREKSEPQACEPELFDAEADMEAAEKQPEKPVADAKAAVRKPEQVKKRPKPEPEPEWLNLPFEELCRTAPALEELRKEGPVMQREVARQREWIMERHRAYMEALHPAPQQEEEPEEEEVPEDSEPSAIDAAGELRALLEQEQEEDGEGSGSVFNDGSDGMPETEPTDREEELTEPEAPEEPEEIIQPDEPEQQEMPLPEEPEQPEEPETAPEPQASRNAEQAAVRKPAKKRAVWPKEEVPRDLRKAAGSWKQRARVQAQRSIIVAVLTVIAVYLSCATDFSLPLPASMDYVDSPNAVLLSFIVLQLIAMVAAYDVIKDGILAAVNLSPNFSTLVDLALVLNLVHCIVRLVWDGEEMPYTCVAMLALFAQMRARVSDARTRHYLYKVAAGAPQPVGIYCRDGDPKHIVKAPMENTEPFVRQTVKPDRGRQVESILTILAVVVSIVLSVIVCVSTGDAGRLIYVLAATMTGACQVALLSAVPMGRCNAARHMMKGGTALDGMRGASELSSAGAVVLTDDDLFPTGSVALERLELRSQLNDATALAYAAALAGDSSLGHMLAEEVRARYGAPLVAHHVVRYTGGGISGRIGGLEILLGGVDFMAERGILAGEVPENGLVLAVESEVAAVLAVDYQVPAVLFNAMQVLTERHIRILLHTRNHQVTPQLVERLYGLHEGTVILPELETDRALRNPRYAAGGTLCGIMMRDGLVPFADCVSTAQGQNRLSAVGAVIGIGAAIICMLLMAYLCFVFVPIDARPIRVLLYAILCFVPIFFLESGVGRD